MIAEKIGIEILKKSLPSIRQKLGLIKEELDHYSENKLIPYIVNSYNNLNISTSQLFRNKGYQIDQLYVPLSLSDAESNDYKIDKYPNKLFRSHSKILIKDSAGMGKSTVLKMIFRFSIDEGKRIPFYIDLKSLIKNEEVLSVENYILDTFPTFLKQPSKLFLLTLLQETPFLFLFDGADEVADNFKNAVFDSVLKFCSNAKLCDFVVATRDEDKILSSFNSFHSCSINPLKQEEAYDLLRKYQFKDVKASDLISELEKKENTPVLEFLKNPLLTTLLYTAYAYKKKVPLKKNLFFGQIFEALYENHDATKIGYLTREKKSGLDIDNFEKILSHLAYVSRVKEKLEYSKSELLEIISDISQSHPTVEFSTRGFVDDLISRVPVLRRDGLIFSWQHKSIQEYLFVRFLFLMFKDEKRENILNKIISGGNVERYKLVLDIVYDENDELFHKIVTNKVLKYATSNCQVRCKGLDKENISINVFYRYFYSQLNSFLPKDSIKEIRRSILSEGVNDFQLIHEEIGKIYKLEEFTMSSCRLTLNDNLNYASLYELPFVTCLRVLFEKSSSFVDKIEFESEDEFTFSSQTQALQNFDRLGSIKELRELQIPVDIYILDINECKNFIDKLENKLKKREERLELLDY